MYRLVSACLRAAHVCACVLRVAVNERNSNVVTQGRERLHFALLYYFQTAHTQPALHFTLLLSSFSISSFFFFLTAHPQLRPRDSVTFASCKASAVLHAGTPRLCVCAPSRSIEIVLIARMYREHLHLGPHPQAGRARPML